MQTTDIISLGTWIKRRRRALDLTQDELATQIGCSKDLIVKIEGDARRPSREIAGLLARTLQLAIDEVEPFIRCARAELAPDRLPRPTDSLPPAAILVVPATQALPTMRASGYLPVQLSSFLGRRDELEDLLLLLNRPDLRLLTITGPGGIGKTRLALQLAAELASLYSDGTWFVDLALLSDAGQVIPTIAELLDVPRFSGRPQLDILKAFLRTRRLLIVLDNCEHVLAAAPQVAELLQAAPGLRVLATSRAALHLTGEHEYPLHPLAFPEPNMHTLAEQVSQYDAVKLFIVRAQAALPSFHVTDANAPTVAELCSRLDGLPLAIELAAARIKLFPAAIILSQIEQDGGLRMLINGPRDHPARQQTIRAAIDWSYQLLSPAEQALLRTLTVCVGGWTLEMAEALVRHTAAEQPAAIPEHTISDTLAALVDHSLVLLQDDTSAEARYNMLALIRAYTLEQLQAAGEEQWARQRHAAYLAEWIERRRVGTHEDVGIPRIKSEYVNLQTALAWSLACDTPDVEYGLRIVGALWDYWFVLAYFGEGQHWIQCALAVCEHRPPDLLTARILNAAARLFLSAFSSSDVDPADTLHMLKRSLDLACTYGDRELEAEVRRHIGESLCVMGRPDAARQSYEASLEICRTLHGQAYQHHTAWTLYVLAQIDLSNGQTQQALERLTEAQQLFEAAYDITGQGSIAALMAYITERSGDTAAAIEYLARAVAFFQQSNSGVAPPNITESMLAYKRGEYDHCLGLLRNLYDQAHQYGLFNEMFTALAFEAIIHLVHNDIPQVLDTSRRLLTLQQEHRLDLIGMGRFAVVALRVAVQQSRYLAAARLIGSFSNYDSHEPQPDPELEHWLAQDTETCRAALSAAEFQEAWMAGRSLPLRQAIADALGIELGSWHE